MEFSNEAIYTKHKDDLIRYASVLVGPTDAEDVLSTVIVRVLERRSLSDLDDARAYLFRAILNEARGRARRREIRLPLERPSFLPERDQEVAASLGLLPPQQRAAVFLVYWEDQTIVEAAATLGVRPGTIKRYLHLARNRLKGVLGDV